MLVVCRGKRYQCSQELRLPVGQLFDETNETGNDSVQPATGGGERERDEC